MRIDLVTLFPSMFTSPFAESIVQRAIKKKLIDIKIHNLRDWAVDKYKTVDDRPFGGGVGMILKVDIIDRCLKDIGPGHTILLSPRGKRFTEQKAETLAKLDRIILICGHYEGVDQRVADHLVDEEISIGDFITTGGELPAMLIIDSVVRLLPGVLGKNESSQEESFSSKLNRKIEYPQYTRPAEYRGWSVPTALLSGNPKLIEEFKKKNTKENTD